MIVTHIAACSENRVIGQAGDLPWNIPEDMKFFRDTTKGHIIIMGRKTFDSFKGRLLPKRYHIVITRTPQPRQESESSPVVYVKDLEAAFAEAKAVAKQWPEEVFIIGGGEIYRQSMPFTDRIYLTLIHRHFAGDTLYPQVDEHQFKLVARRDVQVPIPFSFLTYEK